MDRIPRITPPIYSYMFQTVIQQEPGEEHRINGRAPDAQWPPRAAMRPRNILALWPTGLCHQPGPEHVPPAEGTPHSQGQGPGLPTGILTDSTYQPPGQRLLVSHPALGGGPDGQGVSLCVEHVGVQAQQVGVVGEEQIQVFERLSQKEALHLVPGLGVAGVLDVADGRIAARGDLLESRGHKSRCWLIPLEGCQPEAPPTPGALAHPRTHCPPGQGMGRGGLQSPEGMATWRSAMVPSSDQTPSATSKTCAGLTKAPKPPEGCRVHLRGHRAKVKSQPCQGGQWALGIAGGGAGWGPRPGE